MNRLLSNVSVKMSLTLILAIFSVLILIISFLGHRAGEEGSTSLNELDVAADQMRAVNRSQQTIANAQLFYVNSFVAAYEGDARAARDYLEQAQIMQQAAQGYFAEFESMTHQAGLAEEVITTFHNLTQQGLVPLQAALASGSETQFRTLRETSSGLNQQFIEAASAYNDYRVERNHQLVDAF